MRLGLMLEAELINYKYYLPWCNEVIRREDSPPDWIMDLYEVKYQPDAINIARSHAYWRPAVVFERPADFYAACLFIKYHYRMILWASFLLESGRFVDCCSEDSVDCEYFFCMLNELEDSEYNSALEAIQVKQFAERFSADISEVEGLYRYFLFYFRQNKSAETK